jgi:hypothetical protein
MLTLIRIIEELLQIAAVYGWQVASSAVANGQGG